MHYMTSSSEKPLPKSHIHAHEIITGATYKNMPAVVGGFSVPDEALLSDDAGCDCCCCCCCCGCCGNCNVVEEVEDSFGSRPGVIGAEGVDVPGASVFLSEDGGALKKGKIK